MWQPYQAVYSDSLLWLADGCPIEFDVLVLFVQWVKAEVTQQVVRASIFQYYSSIYTLNMYLKIKHLKSLDVVYCR